jgi:hypothetical protein
MRLRRSQPATPAAPSAQPPVGGIDRAAVRELIDQARRLGFECYPAGAYAVLAERVERAQELLTAEADRQRSLVDGTELVGHLAHLAGDVLPETAAYATDLLHENGRLALANAHLERDVSIVAEALIDAEFPTTEGP